MTGAAGHAVHDQDDDDSRRDDGRSMPPHHLEETDGIRQVTCPSYKESYKVEI